MKSSSKNMTINDLEKEAFLKAFERLDKLNKSFHITCKWCGHSYFPEKAKLMYPDIPDSHQNYCPRCNKPNDGIDKI